MGVGPGSQTTRTDHKQLEESRHIIIRSSLNPLKVDNKQFIKSWVRRGGEETKTLMVP